MRYPINTLQVTTDYEMFQLMDENRNIKRTNLLMQSMKEFGFIPAYPLYCVMKDGRITVRDGHHRLVVASKLGIPVYFVVCSHDITMQELNQTIIAWTPKDYVVSLARKGNPDYILLKEYHEKSKIVVLQCASMLSGHPASACPTTLRQAVKSGRFTVSDQRHIDQVIYAVSVLQACGFKWAAKRDAVATLSRILLAGHAEFKRLVGNIKKFSYLLKAQATADEYMAMWDEVYNYKAQTKIPLNFLTRQAMNERSAVKQQAVELKLAA